jgi:hypothetical protein
MNKIFEEYSRSHREVFAEASAFKEKLYALGKHIYWRRVSSKRFRLQ